MIDIRGLQTQARFDSLGGPGLRTIYDRYGRVERNLDYMESTVRSLTYFYDAGSNLTQLRYPDFRNVNYGYSSGGQFNEIRDHSNAQIADFNYNTRGELATIGRPGGAPDQTWTYDPLGRLASSGWSGGGSSAVSWSYTRNPASQILTETQSNDLYSWDGQANVTRNYTTNGLNQYTQVSNSGYCYDPNGNLTSDGQYMYLYDVENRLVEKRLRPFGFGGCPTATTGYNGALQAKLIYDPLGRLAFVEGYSTGGVQQSTTRFLHDGDALVAEYDGAGNMLKRYVHGPNPDADDPLIEYTGTGTAAADRRNLYADARGSVVLYTDSSGATLHRNSYDGSEAERA